ncbi:GNAT family N-acetyltransferase [Micromonospora sp. NPDC050495]|uniref:GNAT family N-acetyltransferase n=1 Tax=Micromonospora sp. NPDC050495 TaxID=3154936 RepID=UPI0033F1B1B4
MAEPTASTDRPTDLGDVLRRLRRRADLSQRELAVRAGVPQAAVARIESGRAGDPRYRTVERLVRAAGGELRLHVGAAAMATSVRHEEQRGMPAVADPATSSPDEERSPDDEQRDVSAVADPAASSPDDERSPDEEQGIRAGRDEEQGTRAGRDEPLAPVPHDGLRDRAERRYPAHLDVWEVREPKDWPGAWWAEWYNLPPERWPLPLPPATYELSRRHRDRRRWANWVRGAVAVRRVTGPALPLTSWRFVAELPYGDLLGELRAHERSPHLQWGGAEPAEEREVIIDGVLVAAEHRRLGIGRRLVRALVAEMPGAGIQVARAIADGPGVGFLLACGFRLEASRPAALRLDRPAGSGPAVSGARLPPR